MKKVLLSFSLLLTGVFAYAQNGLDSVIVERYYISDANDVNADGDGGVLPVGSKTYRIYVDMQPGYKFQAVYGVNTPGAAHEMRIETNTMFFNNIDRGATSPTFSKNNAKENTVMLDSWLSSGAACTGQMGVLKTMDDGVATVVNNYSPQVLQNNDPWAGIPVSQQDGMMPGSPEPVTAVGISSEITVFEDQTVGNLFFSDNGSWASLNGSMGLDSVDNKVLIAQITTIGDSSWLCFQLNIQIGTPTGGVENYVAINPVGTEISIPSLIYCSTTGINDELASQPSSFNVYPNPASDNLKIQIKSASKSADNSYTIYDIAGKVVAAKSLGVISANHIENVDITSLAKGYYVMQLQMDGVTSSQKIIKH